jgi:SET domain-containing protein
VAIPPRIDERYVCYRLEVKRSSIHCWGVFAAEAIPARCKVIEYTGERIGRRERKQRSGRKMICLFELNSYWWIDGARGGSGAERINHSCDPNLYSAIRNGHIIYMSRRAIRPGEELTVDYRFDKDMERHACRCGASRCRGTINR